MSLFVLDTAGDQELLLSEKQAGKTHTLSLLKEKPSTKAAPKEYYDDDDDEEEEDDGDYFGLPPPNVDISKLIDAALLRTEQTKTKVQEELEHASDRTNAAAANAKEQRRVKRKRLIDIDYSDFNETTGKFDDESTLLKTDVDKIMASSDTVGGLEKLKQLPSVSMQKQRKLNRLERGKSKGAGWFNLPATEVTEEVENDLKLLQMRSVLNPKHFYKKNDLKVLPKYFQMGTVQHSPLDYYSERNTRKNKKRTLVDELLADAEVQKFTKRKYKEVLARKEKYAHRKSMKKMKKLKKNK